MKTSDRRMYYEALLIIGTTTPPEDRLPKRLAPIYREKDPPHRILVPVDERGPELPHLNVEDSDWLDEQQTEGAIVLFPMPLQALVDHALLQLDPLQPPELIPNTQLEDRLTRYYWNTLEIVEESLSEHISEAVLALAAQALRAATRRNSIPRLLQLSLVRNMGEEEKVQYLERELLATFTSEHCHEEFLRFSHALVLEQRPLPLIRRHAEKELDRMFKTYRAGLLSTGQATGTFKKALKPPPSYFSKTPTISSGCSPSPQKSLADYIVAV